MSLRHALLIALLAIAAGGCHTVYVEEDTPPAPPIDIEQNPQTGAQTDWQPIDRRTPPAPPR